MGKTYRQTGIRSAEALHDVPLSERSVRESRVLRWSAALKKIIHHRERQSLRTATANELKEAL